MEWRQRTLISFLGSNLRFTAAACRAASAGRRKLAAPAGPHPAILKPAPARWQTSQWTAAATRRPNPRPPTRPAGTRGAGELAGRAGPTGRSEKEMYPGRDQLFYSRSKTRSPVAARGRALTQVLHLLGLATIFSYSRSQTRLLAAALRSRDHS